MRQIFVDKSDREILKIIEKLVVPIDKNKNFRVLFIYEFMDEKVREKYMATDYRTAKQRNLGDPLYSLTEYFLHFEKDVDEEERDWGGARRGGMASCLPTEHAARTGAHGQVIGAGRAGQGGRHFSPPCPASRR